MRTPPHPTRRALLAGAGVVALTGPLAACDLPGPSGPDRGRGSDADGRPERSDPDLAHVESASAGTEELLALVAATTATHPGLRSRLAPLTACHRAHLQALGRPDEGDPTTPTPGAATATPSPTAAPPASAADVPAQAPRALRRVVARETAHATALVTAARSAESGALARLLATMGAGVHMHLEALEEGTTPW